MEERWLNAKEIATHLGLTVNTVRLWCLTRGLPHVRVGTGHEIRSKATVIDAWLAEGSNNHGGKNFQRLSKQTALHPG